MQNGSLRSMLKIHYLSAVQWITRSSCGTWKQTLCFLNLSMTTRFPVWNLLTRSLFRVGTPQFGSGILQTRGRNENTFLTTLSMTNDLSPKMKEKEKWFYASRWKWKKMKSDFTSLCEIERKWKVHLTFLTFHAFLTFHTFHAFHIIRWALRKLDLWFLLFPFLNLLIHLRYES